MIQLHRDYMFLETAHGEIIPCTAEMVTIELIGDAVKNLDRELVRQAARAVLHYFKEDLHCTTVSVGEFSKALAQALQALGIRITDPDEDSDMTSHDLRALASGAVELSFFTKLREELRAGLVQAPKMVRFHNLRGCVKQLVGVRRWNCRCQELNDQIVEYLRACLATETTSCGLVIR